MNDDGVPPDPVTRIVESWNDLSTRLSSYPHQRALRRIPLFQLFADYLICLAQCVPGQTHSQFPSMLVPPPEACPLPRLFTFEEVGFGIGVSSRLSLR